MKIAVNTRFLLPDKLEGIGWFTYETTKLLVERHPDWEFVFLFDRPFSKEFIFGENVRAEVIAPPARHPWLWYAWFEWAVPRVLNKHKPDVFYSPDGYCSLKYSGKTYMVLHDIAWKHYPKATPARVLDFYKKNVPKYLEKADRIGTVSHFSKQDMVDTFSIPENKIDVLYNGCSPRFSPLGATEKEEVQKKYSMGCPYFLYLGSIHPRKNVEGLITAFESFKKQNENKVKLLITGRFAWLSSEVKAKLEKSAYRNDIIWVDYLPAVEQVKVIGAALALTYLSFFEGFGMPILEAMYCDVPSICSNLSSMPEVGGNAALLVNPHDTQEVVNAMLKIANDDTLRNFLIETGKIHRQKFSWQQTVERLEKGFI